MHLRVNLLFHIVVLVLGHYCYSALTVLLIDSVGRVVDYALALLEAFSVMIANDVVHISFLNRALHTKQMEESLITLGGLRTFVDG